MTAATLLLGMGSYQPRSRVVEAIQLTRDNMSDVAQWCGGTQETFVERVERIWWRPWKPFLRTYRAILFQSPEGWSKAVLGDYILHEPTGPFYCRKPSTFKSTFEVLESEEA